MAKVELFIEHIGVHTETKGVYTLKVHGMNGGYYWFIERQGFTVGLLQMPAAVHQMRECVLTRPSTGQGARGSDGLRHWRVR